MTVGGVEKVRFGVGLISLIFALAILWLGLWAVAAPPLFGWSPVAVMSGSMAPRIETGDVVIVTPYEGEALDRGTVIVFDNPASNGRITHRVVDVTPSGDYVTRGDANGRLDSTAVAPEDIVGVGRLLVPVVAKPLVWADRGEWLLLALFVLAAASAVWTSRWALLDKYDPWKSDDDMGVEPIVLNPGGSASEVAPYVVIIALSLAILAFTTTRSRAVFAGFADNTANSMQADIVEPPTALAASVGGPSSIDLTWTPSITAWADGYELFRSLASDSGYTSIATVPGSASSSHTDSFTPQPGTSYFYVGETYAGGWTSVSSNVASDTTAGLPDVQLVGSWGTGLSHTVEAGNDRGLVLITGNEQRTPVQSLGSWGTGLTHTAAAGSERALVFIAGHEHSAAPAPAITSVTYGGQALTLINGASAGTTESARVEIWILNEAGIAAATDATFVPTWDAAPDLPMYSHAFFGGVDQTTPTGAKATTFSDVATPNPIATAALATTTGTEVVVNGAVAGNTGTYTPQNGFVPGNNQNAGSTTTLGTAYKAAAAATETPSMSHSGPNRQVIAGVVLNASATAAPTVTSVSYGGQPMSKVTGVSVGASVTAATEVWFLDEAGIGAATDGTFVPTWDSTPDLPLYSHAFFSGVDQSDPIGDVATNSSGTGTPNPITTPGLSTVAGDVVVTGAVAGETGSYTPQNGFTLGNSQSAAGTYTFGTGDKSAAAGTETPSMLHSAADPLRQVVAGAVLNRRRAVLANAWTTGLTHSAGTGNDRMLVFVGGMENGANPGVYPQGQRDLISVTYGGQPLIEASEIMICTANAPSAFCARVELWYLLESGIVAATDSTFTPTWTGDPPFELEEMYAAVTLDRVHQTAPTGNISTKGATTNPIQPVNPVGVGRGDIVVVAAMGGMDDTYTEPAGYTEGTDQMLLSSTLATAFHDVAADGTEQPSISFDGTINRQAVIVATIKAAGTP